MARVSFTSRIGGAVAVALVLSVAPMPGGAQAQGLSEAESQRGITVLNRPRRDYDPLGVRLGGFRLDGEVDGALGWDSNIYGRSRNVVSDGFAMESARVDLRSDWTTHQLGAFAGMTARQYFSHHDLNWEDYNAGVNGRYDFGQFDNISAGYTHTRGHLDVWNYDVQASGISKPVPYDMDELNLSALTRFNRLAVAGLGVARMARFQDTVLGTTPQNLSRNDYNLLMGGLVTNYAMSPGRYATLIGRVTDISYQKSISSGRDSFTWEILGGFQYDFDGVWQGRIALGWQQRNYRDPMLKNLEGPAIEGELTWAFTQITTIRAAVRRTIEESIRTDAVSFTRTTGRIDVDHELRRNIIASADYAVEFRQYESPKQDVTDGVLGLGVRYLINRNFSAGLMYGWYHRIHATQGIQEYSRHQIMLRLRASL